MPVVCWNPAGSALLDVGFQFLASTRSTVWVGALSVNELAEGVAPETHVTGNTAFPSATNTLECVLLPGNCTANPHFTVVPGASVRTPPIACVGSETNPFEQLINASLLQSPGEPFAL